MIPAWAAAYVGIPFKDGGRTREGCDCYGLVWMILREQFDLALPSYAGAYVSAHERVEVATLLATGTLNTGWQPLDAGAMPRAGDSVVLRLQNRPWHVGMMLDAEHFLHVDLTGGSSVVERLDSTRWARRIAGIFRHPQCEGR